VIVRRAVVVLVSVAATLIGCAPQAVTPPILKAGDTATVDGLTVTVVQGGLKIPWDIAFDPAGRMLVTERDGDVRVYASAEPGAALLSTTPIPDVLRLGEGGGMGIAIDRDFAAYPFAYVCATRDTDGADGPSPTINELLRFRLDDAGTLTLDGPPLVTGARAHKHHNGCAVEMDADEHIWMTMGEANTARTDNLAQDPGSINGKVLRINRDGSIPDDNPILPGNDRPTAVYTLGHRNPQGIAIRPSDGLIMSVEHGTDRDDEINHVLPGANFGYACYSGADSVGPALEQEGSGRALCVEDPAAYQAPAWSSGNPTIATSGATFLVGDAWGDWQGHLVVTTLKEMDLRLFQVATDGSVATQVAVLLDEDYGRLRAVTIGPDGALYVSTSNNGGDGVLRVEREQPAGS
jgi:glucose/arabinose dehydrogenase